MRNHIDSVVIPDILRNWEDKSVAGNAFIDFKKYDEHIDYIYDKLAQHNLTRDNIKLKADVIGLHIDYKRS